jgi:hypothetical protein
MSVTSKIVHGNPEVDFFIQNPEFNYIKEINSIKSKLGEEETSKLLWAVYMIEDPYSRLESMPYQLRVQQVTTEYLKKEYSDTNNVTTLKEYQELRKIYLDLIVPRSMKNYLVWKNKIDQITDKMDSLDPLSDDLFKYMEKSAKIWAPLKTLEKLMEEELNKTSGKKGNSRESYSERRARNKNKSI